MENATVEKEQSKAFHYDTMQEKNQNMFFRFAAYQTEPAFTLCDSMNEQGEDKMLNKMQFSEGEYFGRSPKLEPGWMSWLEVVGSETPATDHQDSKLTTVDDEEDFTMHHQELGYAHHKHYLHNKHQYCNYWDVVALENLQLVQHGNHCGTSNGECHVEEIRSNGSECEPHFTDDYPQHHHHYTSSNHHHHHHHHHNHNHSNKISLDFRSQCNDHLQSEIVTDAPLRLPCDESSNWETHGSYNCLSHFNPVPIAPDTTQANPTVTMNPKACESVPERGFEEAYAQLQMRVLNWLEGVQGIDPSMPTDDITNV